MSSFLGEFYAHRKSIADLIHPSFIGGSLSHFDWRQSAQTAAEWEPHFISHYFRPNHFIAR